MLSVLKLRVRCSNPVAIRVEFCVMIRVNGLVLFVRCLGDVYSRGEWVGQL